MTKVAWYAALLLAACGTSDGTNSPADGGGDGGHQTLTCTPDSQPVALSAKYAVQANLLVNVKVTPGCTGAACLVDADSTATLLLLAEVTQTGQTATMTARPCQIQIPPVALKGGNKPVMLTVPRTLVDSVKPVMATASLDGTSTCANFSGTPITLVIGANLANTGSDPLPPYMAGATKLCNGAAATRCLSNNSPAPTEAGCVCDQEGDGKLGASLDAANIPALDDIDKVYVDLRTSVTLAGQVFPSATGQTNPGQRIIGKVGGLKLEQSILGCHRNLAAPATPRECDDSDTSAVSGFNPAVTQSGNGDSTFVAVPLAGSDSCDTVITNQASLFP